VNESQKSTGIVVKQSGKTSYIMQTNGRRFCYTRLSERLASLVTARRRRDSSMHASSRTSNRRRELTLQRGELRRREPGREPAHHRLVAVEQRLPRLLLACDIFCKKRKINGTDSSAAKQNGRLCDIPAERGGDDVHLVPPAVDAGGRRPHRHDVHAAGGVGQRSSGNGH
jgi:hypothetical protein